MAEHSRRTALVTGASGFVGRPLVAALLRANYVVRAATRQSTPFPPGIKRIVVPDFRNTVDWDDIIRDANVIIHAAGLAHADNAQIPESQFDRVNRWATQELASAAARAGVERFVFISSVRAQSGASATGVLNERDQPCPTDAYGRSKLEAEAALRATGVPFTIFRPVVIYGPEARANIRSLMRLASLRIPLPFGGLVNRRSLLSLDNLISAILFALENPAAIGQTYLLADPTALSVREIIVILRRAQGRSPGLIHIPLNLFRLGLKSFGLGSLWDRIGGELIVSTSKLEEAGWHPALDTPSGLAAVIPDYTRSHADTKPARMGLT